MRPLLDAIARNLYMFVDFYLWLHDVMAMKHSRADVHCVTLNKSLKALKESGKSEPERLEQENRIYGKFIKNVSICYNTLARNISDL